MLTKNDEKRQLVNGKSQPVKALKKVSESKSASRVEKRKAGKRPSFSVYKELSRIQQTIRIGIDTEYKPVRDKPTIPGTVQLAGIDGDTAIYIHPKTQPEMIEALTAENVKVFKAPWVVLDYLEDIKGWEWDEINEDEDSKLRRLVIDSTIFWSSKDVQFQFADDEFFRHFILPFMQRTRRWSISRQESNGRIFQDINLPWKVKAPGRHDKDGKMQWYRLAFKLTDIAAMQGIGGLKEYTANVGINMESKDYGKEKVSDIMTWVAAEPEEFLLYALDDGAVLLGTHDKTVEFYNQVAATLGIAPRETWGLSTGKVVASMLAEFLAKKIGVSVDDFYRITKSSGIKGFTALSKFLDSKIALYLAMVDGGRAVREIEATYRVKNGDKTFIYKAGKLKDIVDGVLVDIDIAGCYGNGLRNQVFAIGSPSVFDSMTLGEFEERHLKKGAEQELVPGLWYARVSWKNAPFKQDVLISKVEQAFTNWENGVTDEAELETLDFTDSERTYDASMVLYTRSVSHAALTHDLRQLLMSNASNIEKKWLRENAIVELSSAYEKKYQVQIEDLNEVIISQMLVDKKKLSKDGRSVSLGCPYWVGIPMKEFIDPLLAAREVAKRTYGKKSPLDIFYKLIVNTTYGVIASEFFSGKGTGVSNVIVGNNITARARALAWLMSKGLGSHMSVTDGGVFDLNKVNSFKKKSLNLLEGLSRRERKDAKRVKWIEQVPLMGSVQSPEQMAKLSNLGDIDQTAWNHLKRQFSDIDILEKDQFKFESKDWYIELVLHSKVDYRLTRHPVHPKYVKGKYETKKEPIGEYVVALRGLPKKDDINGVVSMDLAKELFDSIVEGTPVKVEGTWEQLLSLSDWQKLGKSKNPESLEKYQELMPHDVVSDPKRFYSHTPLGMRYEDESEYRAILKQYEKAKETGDPVIVAAVGME